MSWGDTFRKAAAGTTEFDPPNGKYKVRIVDGGAFEAKSDGREWCKVRLEIIGDKHAGEQFEDFGPAGPHGGTQFDRMVERLLGYGVTGLEAFENLEDLDTALHGIIGNEADISVSHNGEYTNINVHGSRTGKSDIPSDPPANGGGQSSFAAAAGAKDDDKPIPF